MTNEDLVEELYKHDRDYTVKLVSFLPSDSKEREVIDVISNKEAREVQIVYTTRERLQPTVSHNEV